MSDLHDAADKIASLHAKRQAELDELAKQRDKQIKGVRRNYAEKRTQIYARYSAEFTAADKALKAAAKGNGRPPVEEVPE